MGIEVIAFVLLSHFCGGALICVFMIAYLYLDLDWKWVENIIGSYDELFLAFVWEYIPLMFLYKGIHRLYFGKKN